MNIFLSFRSLRVAQVCYFLTECNIILELVSWVTRAIFVFQFGLFTVTVIHRPSKQCGVSVNYQSYAGSGMKTREEILTLYWNNYLRTLISHLDFFWLDKLSSVGLPSFCTVKAMFYQLSP